MSAAAAVSAQGAGRSLDGRVALVTGGVRRIGRAIALALAAEGASVAINARSSREEAEGVVREIEGAGGAAMVALADVTDEAAVQDMAARVEARLGPVAVLVNNAAVRRHAPFEAMSYAEWREIMAVILDGAFLCSRAVLPGMAGAGFGRIVSIGGVTAHLGAHERAHVAAAKAGLVGLTKALAVEYAGRGVTVNCVVPGKIGGQRSATSGESPAMASGAGPLVGREGVPEDVAEMVRLLCRPASGFVTGQSIHVSGGMFMP